MAVSLSGYPKFKYTLPTGDPGVGYKLFTYAAGTSTKKNTYTDFNKSATNTNPIILDAAGECDLWLDGTYKLVLAPPNDTDPPASGTTLADNYTTDITATTSGNFNFALNGSFELDSNGDGTPDSWVISELSSGSIALDNTSQAHGLNSLSFTSGGSGGGTATSEDYIDVLAGGVYNGVLSLISSAADTHNLFEVYWYNSAKTYLSKSSVYDEAAANPISWTQYTGQVTAPATAVFAKIVLTGVASDSTTKTTGTKTRFDDVKLFSDTLTELGITSNYTEINTLDVSAMAVTGFTYGNVVYIDDDGDSQGVNIFDASAFTGTWTGQDIGPTGSGATNTWTALDILPNSTKWIEVHVYASATATTSAGYAFQSLYARRNGSSATASNGTFISSAKSTYQTTDEQVYNVTSAKIPVTAKKFDLYRNTGVTAGGSSFECKLSLKAFGV